MYEDYEFDEVDDELTDLLFDISKNDDDFVKAVFLLVLPKEDKKTLLKYIKSSDIELKKKDIIEMSLALHRMRKYEYRTA